MKTTKCLFPEGTSPDGMISVSQIQSWMSCKKKWEYAYLEGLTPRVERPYLTIGKLCHVGMQAAMECLWTYLPGRNLSGPLRHTVFEDLLQEGEKAIRREHARYMDGIEFLNEEFPDFNQICEDAVSIFSQALGEFDPLRWDVLTVYENGKAKPALELHFLVPCRGSKGLHGYIDAILRDRESGQVWCTDYKFRSQLQADEEEQFNLQNAVYMYACHRMGIEVTGTQTWQHLNRPAANPALTKNGVSRTRIKTTWDHYRQFVEQQGYDPEDYMDMKEKLSDVEWFKSTLEYRNPKTIQNVWNEIIVPASWGIRRSFKGDNNRALFQWNCKNCQFRELCQAELRDYDADFIRKSQFTQKTYRQ